jgi:hypothetical protein
MQKNRRQSQAFEMAVLLPKKQRQKQRINNGRTANYQRHFCNDQLPNQ